MTQPSLIKPSPHNNMLCCVLYLIYLILCGGGKKKKEAEIVDVSGETVCSVQLLRKWKVFRNIPAMCFLATRRQQCPNDFRIFALQSDPDSQRALPATCCSCAYVWGSEWPYRGTFYTYRSRLTLDTSCLMYCTFVLIHRHLALPLAQIGFH